jgi:hypothetical protein
MTVSPRRNYRAYRRSTRSPDCLWNLDLRPEWPRAARGIRGQGFFAIRLSSGTSPRLSCGLSADQPDRAHHWIVDLAIGLGLSLITSYDANDLLCQFGSIGLLTLPIQRQGADYQNHNDQ